MLSKLIQVTYRFKTRDYVPPRPRGYATPYDELRLSEDEWRVLRRLGSRDPYSIRLAMRRHGVTSIDELVRVLEHHRPRRRFRMRVYEAFGRMLGGYGYDLHERQRRRALARPRDAAMRAEVRARLERVRSRP